jgi:ADP-ribose pyrophosphatase YjhB (NUDIX family)
MSLRLGVQCAVIDDQGQVLLSQRDDLNVWNLPGGRLDTGETLMAGAAREVQEETGVIVHVERAVGLYYWVGWQRLNILFAGWPLGGDLRQRTSETRANQYFAPDNLPRMLNPQMVAAALSDERSLPQVVEMSPRELRRIRRRLSWRWVLNLLRGRPEPRYPRFNVRVVGVVWDSTYRRVLTLPGKRGRVLPRVVCTGVQAPWQELAELVRQASRLAPVFQWVGVWQDAPRNLLEFVFAATDKERPLPGHAEWSNTQHVALSDREMAYIERVKPSYMNDAVWTILHTADVGHGDMLSRGGADAWDAAFY